MNDRSELADDGFHYDAVVVQLDAVRGIMLVTVGNVTHRIVSPYVVSFAPGAIGRLRLPSEEEPFVFQQYADQRMRRSPELDDSRAHRWGWSIGERRFVVRAGVLPGRGGAVIPLDVESTTIEFPREFMEFCDSRGVTPASICRSLAADVCGLSNHYELPREDNVSSNGKEACEFASVYLSCILGAAVESVPGKIRRRRKRKAEKESAPSTLKSGKDNPEALAPPRITPAAASNSKQRSEESGAKS